MAAGTGQERRPRKAMAAIGFHAEHLTFQYFQRACLTSPSEMTIIITLAIIATIIIIVTIITIVNIINSIIITVPWLPYYF